MRKPPIYRQYPAGALLSACLVLAGLGFSFATEPGRNTALRTIKVEELNRNYYLHVPTNLPPDRGAALVLMFHGGGGTPAYAERESKFSDLADRDGFLAAYPEAIGRNWNDGRGAKMIVSQRDNIDDLAFIAALIDDVAKDHKLDAKRVYATGISNGAIFSHYLAAKMAARIAAIAPVAGGLAEPVAGNFKPAEPVSVLIFQGSDDPLVPYRGGGIRLPGGRERGRIIATDETVGKWVAGDGCQTNAVVELLPDKDPNDNCRVQKITYPKGRNGTEVILYRIEGGGHTWPSGSQYFPETLIGRLCRDLDGTEVIWEFFKAHPKP
jgi:polyhydroxybutyrate depolymerase